MSPEQTPPQRIAVVWSPEARADVRAIDRETALQILYCLDRYLLHREGDVKKLKPPRTDFRLRCGDYRLFFISPRRKHHSDHPRPQPPRKPTAETSNVRG